MNSITYPQYFIDTSKDWPKTGKIRYNVQYNSVEYTYKLFHVIPMKFSSEWEVHYEEERNAIQIHFECTMTLTDWICDFLFAPKMYKTFTVNGEKIKLRACKGWTQMWFAVKKEVREAVKQLVKEHQDAEVEIIGWSLGSAIAQFCAQDLDFNYGIKSHLITFGTVKPWRGSKKLRKYLQSCCKDVHNFMNKEDIVTYMPCFPGFFATNPIKVGQFKFTSIFKLFNPAKHHICYHNEQFYENI